RGDMLGFICDNSRISGKAVGKIDVKGVYSFFEVQNDVVDKVFQGFQNVDFEGRTVRIENAGEGRGSDSGRGDRKKRFGGGRSNSNAEHGSGNKGGFRDFSGKRKESRSKSRW